MDRIVINLSARKSTLLAASCCRLKQQWRWTGRQYPTIFTLWIRVLVPDIYRAQCPVNGVKCLPPSLCRSETSMSAR